MKHYTRAEISLDLGVLGERNLAVTYAVVEIGETLEVEIEQVLLQVGGKMIDIAPTLPDLEIDEIAESLVNLETGETQEVDGFEDGGEAQALLNELGQIDETEQESRA